MILMKSGKGVPGSLWRRRCPTAYVVVLLRMLLFFAKRIILSLVSNQSLVWTTLSMATM